MRLTGSRAYYRPSPPKMPPGLVELMEGLSREVLRHNPSDIYEFCAGHMQQLIEKRDGPSLKKTLPLEKKIARAQEKVRQAAEKRRQAYDKGLLLQQQTNTEKNVTEDCKLMVSIPLPVHEIYGASESFGSKNNSNEPPQHQDSEISLKAPVHHEHEIENSLEVEISCESGSDACIDSDKNEHIDKNISKESNNITEVVNKVPDNNTNASVKIVDNEVNEIEALGNVQDTTESSVNLSVAAVEIEKLNENVDVETKLPIINPGDATTIGQQLTEESSINTPKENIAQEIGFNQKSKENEVVVTNSNDAENVHTKDVQIALDDGKIQQNMNIGELSTQNHEIESNSTQHGLASPVEDLSQPNDIDNIPTSDNTQDLIKQEISDSLDSIVNNHSQPSSDIINIEISDLSELASQAQQNVQEYKFEQENPRKIETNIEIESYLPEMHVDGDIPTLITDSSSNDTQHTIDTKMSDNMLNFNKAIPDSISVTSDDVNVQNPSQQDTKDIDSTSPLHSTEGVSDDTGKETSVIVDDTTQNDKHDTANMDLETAAITIQKVFRTFLFKSRGSTSDETGNDESTFLDKDDNKEECDFPIASALNIDRRAHGITRMDTVLQTVNEEKSLSLSDDSSTLSSAATIIQAHVRGFLVRNKLNSNKTLSTNSFPASNSNDPSITSLEADNEQSSKNKTILNIHIVPEGGENYLSRDESLITSMDLSLDCSPPSSINLHPLGYDKSERRKQLKREDAIQSISPPSNNSGKLSEDFDSVKELSLNDHDILAEYAVGNNIQTSVDSDKENIINNTVPNGSPKMISNNNEKLPDNIKNNLDSEAHVHQKKKPLTKMSSDEMDVVTPFLSSEESSSSKLIHSGEFHDAVLPTRVSRNDTTVASEFKNVLVYFLLWNHT